MIGDAAKLHVETPCLRTAKAAEKLGVSVETLRRWARTKPGFPRPIKLSMHVTVFRESELDEFITTMTTPQLGAPHEKT